MAVEIGSAYVTLLPSMKGFQKQFESGFKGQGNKVGKKTGDDFNKGMGKSISGGAKKLFAPLAAAAGGIAVGALFKDVVNEASDAQQSIGATEAIYGKYADQVMKKSKEAAQAQGLSANEYRESSNLLAALFKNQGVAQDELAGKTHEMVGLSADLAAMYGGTTADAVEALTAAYKGEFNSLEKYGISMKASTVNAEAMAIANVDSAKAWNALSKEEQAAATQQATTNLLMKQSADAQGQATKEADTYAGQMQRLQASLSNTKETLGTALLPIVSSFVGTLNKNVVPAIDGFITGMKEGHGWGGKVADAFGVLKDGATTAFDYVKNDVVPVLQDFKDWLVQNKDTIIDLSLYVGALGAGVLAYKGYVLAANAVQKTWTALTKAHTLVTKAQTAAQKALNFVMKMNPIGLVIASITALVGILIVAYKRHEGFRKLVDKVWASIKEAAGKVVNWFKDTAWPVMKTVFSKIGDVAKWLWNNMIKPYFTFIFNIYKKVFFWLRDTAWPIAKSIFNKVAGAAKGLYENGIKPAFNKTKTIIGNVFTWLSDTAWPKAKAVFDKIKTAVGSIKDAFARARDGIKRAWRNLSNAIARPINGVIDKVNKFLNGLRKALNKIPGVNFTDSWGIRKIILDTSNATVGGQRPGANVALASGGKVPGYSPHDRADNIPAWLTAGEYVLPVKATKRLRAMVGDSGLEALRKGSLPGYADGGLIGTPKWLRGKLRSLTDRFGDSWPAIAARDAIRNLSPKKILDKVFNLFPGAGSEVNNNKSVNYGGYYGWAPVGMKWPGIWQRIKAAAPEAVMTSNYRPGAVTASGVPSLHGLGRAVDIVSHNMPATFNKIRNLLPWSQLFHTPMGNRQIGYRDSIVARTHWDHIHAAFADGGLVPRLYDNGGAIQPGLSLVANKTGKPEQVLTHEQWQDVKQGNGNTIIINGVDTDNTADVADELMFALRRTGRGKYNRRR